MANSTSPLLESDRLYGLAETCNSNRVHLETFCYRAPIESISGLPLVRFLEGQVSFIFPIELEPMLSKSLSAPSFDCLANDPFSEGNFPIIIEVGLGKCNTERRCQRD